jgi:hypothetical protein
MEQDPNPVTHSRTDLSLPVDPAILQRVIADLSPLSDSARQRLIDTVCTFFGISAERHEGPAAIPNHTSAPNRESTFRFSEAEEPPAKQFVHDKAPSTDVERVACLAYYLSRYRGVPHFKTKDITAINTEAAQRPFSNTAFAVENATKTGYLVPSIKGCKQISAAGERFVEALPDRVSAKEVMERAKLGRGGRSSKKDRD